MRLLITGDSHANAILAAQQSHRGNGGVAARNTRIGMIFAFPKALERFHSSKGTVSFTDAAASDALEALAGYRSFSRSNGDTLAILLPYTTSLMLWNEAWKTHMHWRVKGDRLAVSNNVIEAMVHDHYKHVFQFLSDLASIEVPLFAVESPPIRSDDHSIRTGLLSPEELLILDSAIRMTTDMKLKEIGIDVVHCPASTYAGGIRSSFLVESMRKNPARDTHHANGDYGIEMLHAIQNYCDATRPRWDRN